jgi:TRAP-type C4-dicarboxylate transport system substrate-binding protein
MKTRFRDVLASLAMLAAAAAAAAQVVLRQGSNSPPGSVFHLAWLDYRAAVERISAGAIKVDLSTNEPNEANLLSNLRRGRTDCAGVSLQGAATVLPEVAVLQLPYLFAEFKEVDHVYAQPSFQRRYRELFAAKGLVMIDWVEVGFVNLYGVMPIRTPADVRGQKLRATQSRASQAFVKAAGADAVVLPFAELLPGLQTGLIRGGEAGVVIYDAVINKSAPHYTLTQHAFDSGVVLCNKAWYDKLSPAHQQIISGAWNTPALIRAVRAQSEKILADARAKGLSIIRLTEAEQRAWRELSKPAADAVMATLPPEAAAIRDELQALIRAAPR